MPGLPLAPTGDRADPAFKDAAGCAVWLEQLQLTNLQLAHSLLLTQLDRLNRYPMRGLARLDTLEQLRETVHHVQHGYAQKLVAKPLPLNQNELLVFAAIVQPLAGNDAGLSALPEGLYGRGQPARRTRRPVVPALPAVWRAGDPGTPAHRL